MNIFGVKKFDFSPNDLTLRVNDLYRSLTFLNKRLQNAYTNEDITKSKGPLINGELFSFGNAGREPKVGYVMMRRGYITGIRLSSEKSSGEVRVGVIVNGAVLSGCEITLNSAPRIYRLFDNPFLIEAGNVINFVSLGANGTVVNSVASLLIEFKKYI